MSSPTDVHVLGFGTDHFATMGETHTTGLGALREVTDDGQDAGATEVTVIILSASETAGKQLMVLDNASGMSRAGMMTDFYKMGPSTAPGQPALWRPLTRSSRWAPTAPRPPLQPPGGRSEPSAGGTGAEAPVP